MRTDVFGKRAGFTLLEMLVASLLLGMLVTILTMVFNASSIAWRTGKAGVSQLSLVRRQLSLAEHSADNLLPCVTKNGDNGLATGAWLSDKSGKEKLRKRAVDKMPSDVSFSVPNFRSDFNSAAASLSPNAWVEVQCDGSIKMGSANTYVVGVWSYGPDGTPNTDDDITTWPNTEGN
ncbi:MAG: prepilin-type N-terminal cleavage/methylation domain-containing protein [Kiritimatiellae bacterium]|nr:prepilin-type N-terminal cleavage/methylation domain-containing protein [Kiritimatiellia bacterium]